MDRRNRKSIDSILNAMPDLLEKKPLKEILMKELADSADINRSTLYTYYKNPQEVFEDLAKRSIDSFEDVLGNQKYTMTEFIEIYLNHMKKNYPVFLEIHRASVTNGYVERISGIMNRCLQSRKLESGTVLARYCNYGFFGIAAEWGTDNEGYLKYGIKAPKAIFLGYPAIAPDYFVSEEQPEEMKAFRESIVGTDNYEELAEEFSADQHVHSDYPPVYIVYCEDDDMVDPTLHAQSMINALEDNGIVYQAEVGETGGHGFAVGFNTSVEGWFERADSFFESLD